MEAQKTQRARTIFCPVKLFVKRIGLFFTTTAILLALLFFWYKKEDPFQVCNSYRHFENTHVAFNRDYISTQTFLQRCDTISYDAIILGSSRCYAFAPSIWTDFIPELKHIFSFDASQETIRGIRQKLELIYQKGMRPKEVLLVFCNDATFCQPHDADGYLFAKHPALSGASEFNFQLKFFRAFYSPTFLFHYLSYSANGQWKPSMKGYIQQFEIRVDSTTNELEAEAFENHKPDERLFDGTPFSTIANTPQIDEHDLENLEAIKKTLELMGSNYHIILSPLYAQLPFHTADTAVLHQLFPQRVHDYSHRTDITADSRNYYEKSHYNKRIGSYLLSEIYANHE